MDWFTTLNTGHWLVAAAVLGILEALFPGAVFLWFAIAATIVGVLTSLLKLGWEWQLLLFGVLSLASVGAWRRFRRAPVEPLPTLNRRGRQYEGQWCEIIDPIENGFGKAKLGDSVWTVKGPDLPVGSRVRVIAIDGTVLEVVADPVPQATARS